MSAGEREFIFDAVVGFLTSPIWNSPVRTFIEQNSLGMNYFSCTFRIFVQPRRNDALESLNIKNPIGSR